MAANNKSGKRTIKRTLSDNGWIVKIPTSDNPNGPHVTMYAKSWQTLLEAGIYPILNIDIDGYVMVHCPKYRTYKRLARLIKNCKEGDRVSILNGDELNLLDENIHVVLPEPPRYDRSFLSPEDMPYFAQVVDYETIFPEGNIDPAPRFKTTFNEQLKQQEAKQ